MLKGAISRRDLCSFPFLWIQVVLLTTSWPSESWFLVLQPGDFGSLPFLSLVHGSSSKLSFGQSIARCFQFFFEKWKQKKDQKTVPFSVQTPTIVVVEVFVNGFLMKDFSKMIYIVLSASLNVQSAFHTVGIGVTMPLAMAYWKVDFLKQLRIKRPHQGQHLVRHCDYI